MLKKRLIPILLVLVMFVSLIPCAAAAEENEAAQSAENLHVLGLFQGTGTDADGNPIFELDKGVTRAEAVTMLVRLLGKEWETKNGTWEVPFEDVPAWAVPYVGYAYANGLAKGTGGNTFSAANPVSAQDYLTLLLRALQYREEAGEFSWARASETTDLVGLTHGDYSDNRALTRGDVATLSFRVLSCGQNRTGTALIRTLYDNGVVNYDQLEYVGLSPASGLETLAAPTNMKVKENTALFVLQWSGTMPRNGSV